MTKTKEMNIPCVDDGLLYPHSTPDVSRHYIVTSWCSINRELGFSLDASTLSLAWYGCSSISEANKVMDQ